MFLHRLKQACDLLKTDWIINLHPDVICQNKICYYPPSFICGVGAGSNNGVSNNNFSVSSKWYEIYKYIKAHQPNCKLNGWGWCGGSIMNISKFYEIYNNIYSNNPNIIIENIEKIYKEAVRYEDTLLPIIFNLYGFEYRIWKDNPEYHRGKSNLEGAFLHGYKEHYNLKKKGMTLTEWNNNRLNHR